MVLPGSLEKTSMDKGIRPCWLRVENISVQPGLKVKIGQTWSQHGPDMVPNNRDSMAIDLRWCYLSLKNCIALAGLEVKLGQTCSQHGPDMVQKNNAKYPRALAYFDTVLNNLEL